MPKITMKVGDTRPLVNAVLKDSAGPINLRAASVEFRMTDSGSGSLIVGDLCEIVSEAAGQVRYHWKARDTANAGRFAAVFVITFSDGTVLTCPSVGVVDVVIS